jgi:hypothetical protein
VDAVISRGYTVRFAIILENNEVSLVPRDQATVEWLVEPGVRGNCYSALRALSEHWLNRKVSRRKLRLMAAELEQLIWDRYGRNPEVSKIEVRACEYVPPPATHVELREIR